MRLPSSVLNLVLRPVTNLVLGLIRPRLIRMRAELKVALEAELTAKLRSELYASISADLKAELTAQLEAKLLPAIESALQQRNTLLGTAALMQFQFDFSRLQSPDVSDLSRLDEVLRTYVRTAAGLRGDVAHDASIEDLLQEVAFLRDNLQVLAPLFASLMRKRVLYAGQAYYNAWYLSRSLRERGWKADVLNWDTNPGSQIYYHGDDFNFLHDDTDLTLQGMRFYVASLYGYDIFHFSNAHAISFGGSVQNLFESQFGARSEIELLKGLGKKIVYTNNGCLDGVSQSSFSKWGPESVCSICRWQSEPSICSDERNLTWGEFRNRVADYQCLLGGNRVDFNDDPSVHEVPEFYCLDKKVWSPDIEIPEQFRLSASQPDMVWLYHAVGQKIERTSEDGVNIKSSHIYLPLIKRLKDEGLPVEVLEPVGVPNKEVRFIQAQADICLDMLTYGWFGATVREAMMLGKPVVCYIRPQWLQSLREEIPQYADELPIVSATPHTVEAVLRDLIANPEKRRAIGARSREFAIKWHSSQAGGSRFDEIYSRLLAGDLQLRD